MKNLPPWTIRALFVLGYLSLAFWSHTAKRWGLFGFAMFAAGEAWGRLICEIIERRLKRERDTWEQLAEGAYVRLEQTTTALERLSKAAK